MTKFTFLSVLLFGSMVLFGYSEPVVSTAFGNKLLNVKVFIEGAFDAGTGAMSTALNTGAVLPIAQPFNVSPWNYAGTESVASIPAGIVDWILVELRDAATPATAITGYNLAGWPRALFLKSDGSIVDLNGTSMPDIGTPSLTNSLFVVIRHRNHLAVLSSAGATLAGDIYSYDFTTDLAQAFGGTVGYKMSGSKAVMKAGDIDHDENIYVSDYNSWAAGFGATTGYFTPDIDMDRNVYVSDYNKWASNFGSTTSIGTGLGCTFTDSRDGRVYRCVVIGTQTWMAENLAYLPSVTPSNVSSYTTPYNYVHGYSGTTVSEAKATANFGTYGVLYNWPAATAACPSGYHLPIDEEWKTLEKNQGMSQLDSDAEGWRNSGTVGSKLKEAGTSHWYTPNTGATNSSGFTALPGGNFYGGNFVGLRNYARFWSATTSGMSYAWYRVLYYGYAGVARYTFDRDGGFAIRCLKDE